jgi:hypothetical protein
MPELSNTAPTTMVVPLTATAQPNPLPLAPVSSFSCVQLPATAGVAAFDRGAAPGDAAMRAGFGCGRWLVRGVADAAFAAGVATNRTIVPIRAMMAAAVPTKRPSPLNTWKP